MHSCTLLPRVVKVIDELAIVELDGVSVHLVLLGRAQALKGNAQSLTVQSTTNCYYCYTAMPYMPCLYDSRISIDMNSVLSVQCTDTVQCT